MTILNLSANREKKIVLSGMGSNKVHDKQQNSGNTVTHRLL